MTNTMNDFEVQKKTADYIRDHILMAGTAMLDDLFADGMLEFDDVTNVYPNPYEWDSVQCVDWMEGQNYEKDLEDISQQAFEDEDNDRADDDFLESMQQFIHDHAEAAEILEWYAVSGYLYNELITRGEPVFSDPWGNLWWGRTTSGQAVYMDHVIQSIATT